MMAHAINMKAEADGSETEVSLVCMASSKTDRPT